MTPVKLPVSSMRLSLTGKTLRAVAWGAKTWPMKIGAWESRDRVKNSLVDTSRSEGTGIRSDDTMA